MRGILLFFLMISGALAKDLGVHGHLFPIEEPDLLLQIEEKLESLEKSGELKQHQEKLLKQAQEKVKNPEPVKGLVRARKTRTYLYDPSLTLPYDLKDPQGQIFHKAGTTINPLKIKSLSKDLVFFDGTDETQLQWVEKTYLNTSKAAKLIMVAGKPFEVMERWNKEVYFDQQGRLIQKFRIKAVPAFIRQKDLYLEITEVGHEE